LDQESTSAEGREVNSSLLLAPDEDTKDTLAKKVEQKPTVRSVVTGGCDEERECSCRTSLFAAARRIAAIR
jgi:hypothetical protein